MKKTKEKGIVSNEAHTKSRILLGCADPIQNMSLSPSSSLNKRSLYTPIINTSVYVPKLEVKEVDKADTPKRKNRRRERRHKVKVSNLDNTLASASTSNSSGSINHQSPVHAVGLTPIGTTTKAKANTPNKVQGHEKTKVPAQIYNSLVDIKFTYEIYPVKKTGNGKVFRKRSKKHKYIKLKTFLEGAKTCIFETNYLLTKLMKSLSLEQKQILASQKAVRKVNEEISPIQSGPSTPDAANKNLLELQQDGGQISNNASPKRRRSHKRKNKEKIKLAKKIQEVFLSYLPEDEAMEGLAAGELIRGFVRVNPKNANDAYVSNEDTAVTDYCITSVMDRNRALDGDEVLLKVKPQKDWLEGRKTATVVYILKKFHPRSSVGNLKPDKEHADLALFFPRDKRMPIMRIPCFSWPQGFKQDPKKFKDILFTAQLLDWPEPRGAQGVVTGMLGKAGDLTVETQAILKEFCLDTTPFSQTLVDQYLPQTKQIPAKEFEYREDIRKECVFTIDPLTARDLDDALSVKELSNGHYEIGVHISDASYYLPEGTVLDQKVGSKATTIYLVDSVYHMLPVELCLHCSLLPGQDKLAFSVFWEIDEQGTVYDTRFARTVVNSCAQLAYEHAQQMIEDPNKDFKLEELPKIMNGFTAKDLSKTVNILKKIATNLREARVQNGSLRIDQVKLLFSLNATTGEPLDFIVYENKESHRLIEEFMLLANISVARKIEQSFPDIAFLRCHEEPKYTMLLEAQKCLETCGIHVDISSSGGIHSSLRKYITDDQQGVSVGIVLNHLFAKPMTRARYFCASTMDSSDKYVHYALSVPIYTHFTSPIRRYADIMVHRLLAASLGYAEKPKWEIDQVISIAANCNKQKYNAKRAGEASSDLYLAHYIEKYQPCIEDCVVVDVKDRSFDAIVLKTGSVVRIHQQKCEDNPTWKSEVIPTSGSSSNSKPDDKKFYRMVINYPSTAKIPSRQRLIVEMFTVVKVKLTRVPNTYKLEPFLMRPLFTMMFERTTSTSTP